METSTYEQQAIDFLTSTQTKFASEFKEFGSMPFDQDGMKRNIFTVTLQNDRHAYSFCFGSSLAESCKPHSEFEYSNDKKELYFGFTQGIEKEIAFRITIEPTYTTLREVYDNRTWLSLFDPKQITEAYENYREQVEISNAKARRKRESTHIVKSQRDIENDFLIPQVIRQVVKLKETKGELGILQADEILHPTAYDVLTCLTKSDPGTFENFCSEYGYDTDSRSAVRTYKSVRKEWNAVSKLFSDKEIEQLQEIQ